MIISGSNKCVLWFFQIIQRAHLIILTLDNSNRYNVLYYNPGLRISKPIDWNRGDLSDKFVSLSNGNSYDVVAYKAKTPSVSNTEEKDLIKNVFVSDRFDWIKEFQRLHYCPSDDAAYFLSCALFGNKFPEKVSRVKNL